MVLINYISYPIEAANVELQKEPIKVLVVSDMDDTVKVSNVRDHVERISYSVFNDSLFYGMNLAYQAIKKKFNSQYTQFYYLSNGWRPTVEESHQAILNNFSFPDAKNYLPRSFSDILKRVAHKKIQIQRLVTEVQPELLIFIGDNGEKDAQIYHEMHEKIKSQYSAQGKSIKILTYIHTVYKPTNIVTGDLYPEQVAFSNAAELAVLLSEAKVIGKIEALKVATDVLLKAKLEKKNGVYGPLVNPYFKYHKGSVEFNNRQCLRIYKNSPFTSILNQLLQY